MKLASRLKVAATLASAGVYNMGAAAAKCRTLAQAIADGAGDASAIKVGDTGVPFTIEDAAGNWEDGLYAITSNTQITRTSVVASSAGGTTAAAFSGPLTAFNAASGAWLSRVLVTDDGQDIASLPTVSAAPAGSYALLVLADGSLNRILASNLVGSGSSTPADTTAPAVSSAQVANASPAVIAITMNETLANSAPPASAFTVSGGKTVSSVSISGAVVSITVSAAYAYGDAITVNYTAPNANPRLQDAAANPVASFTGRAVTNNISAPAGGGSTSTIVFSKLSGMTVSNGTYTTNAGISYNSSGNGGVSTTSMVGNGSITVQIGLNVAGLGQGKPALGLQLGTNVEAITYFGLLLMANPSGYGPFYTNSGIPGAAGVIPKTGDLMRMRRAGTMVYGEVCQNGTDWILIWTWDAGTTANMFAQILGEAGASLTNAQGVNFTGT